MARRLHVLDERPKTRRDCVDGVRPCPWVGCRHHLLFEVTKAGHIRCQRSGAVIKWSSPDAADRIADMLLEHGKATCTLDVTDQHPDGLSVEEIAHRLGVDLSQVERATRRAMKGVLREFQRQRDDE